MSLSATGKIIFVTSLLLSRVCFCRGGLVDNSFWTSTNTDTNTGCETVNSDGSVLCSCNHLTHFAILLSPGVVRERERRLSVKRKGGVSSYNSNTDCVWIFVSAGNTRNSH